MVLIFFLHNIEEYIFYYRMPAAYFKLIGDKIKSSKVFLCAIILLSFLALVVALFNYFISSGFIKIVSFIMCFAIFINALQHVGISCLYRKILPGTFTATFFIIPFSIFCWITLHESINVGPYSVVLFLIVSLIVMLLSIYGSLWGGYFLIKLMYKTRIKN